MSATDDGSAVTEKRLTPTERLHEVTMAAIGRRPAEPESSVTISRNARGVYQFEVTVRDADAVAARERAAVLADELARAYPYPETNGNTE